MHKSVQPVIIGLILGLLTLILAGLGGAAFGKNEDGIKAMLHSKAAAVLADQEQATKNAGGAWKELKRAHSHAEGLGVIILATTLVIAFTKLIPTVKTLLALGVGLGGLLYPVTIVLESFRITTMGKDAAVESLEFMAVGSIGIFMLSVGITFLYVVFALSNRPGFFARWTEKG